MWDAIFGFANFIAVAMWAVLILLPRKPALLAAVLYAGVGLLCLTYVLVFAGLLSGVLDPVRDAGAGAGGLQSYSVDGLKDLFRSRGAIVIGWVHYLAFDLFVGLWIARDADAKGFSRLAQAPVLGATFMAGPLGLLLWLGLRERRARKSGRWS